MYKKLFFLVSLMVMFGLVGSASAAIIEWGDDGSGHLWSTNTNWRGDTLPTTGDEVHLHFDPNFVPVGSKEWPIVDNSMTVTMTDLYLGYQWAEGPRYDPPDSDPPNEGALTMTGGSLTATNMIRIAEKGYGTFTMTGGDLYTGTLQLGRDAPKANVTRSTAVFNISGGTYHGGNLAIPNDYGNGHVQVEGTAIVEPSGLNMDDQIAGGGVGTLDINSINARVSPEGDERTTISDFISWGWIKAFGYTHGTIVSGQRATIIMDYDVTADGRTTLIARWTDPNRASLPSPSNGTEAELDPNNKVVLSWLGPGSSHDVFYGTTWADVNNGTGGTSQGNQAGTTFYTPALTFGDERFWRIDEVAIIEAGLIDDGFESDSGKWATPTGTWVQMNANAAHTGSNSSGLYGKSVAAGTMTSVNLDTSDACSISVDFWYNVDGDNGATMDLLFYNGATYDTIVTGLTGGSWDSCSVTTTNANYRRADFKIKFSSGGTGNKNGSRALIDDLVVSKVTNDNLVYKGDVWSFTAADYLVVEDFPYPDDANLRAVWDDGVSNGTTSEITVSGKAMAVYYNNSSDIAEADRSLSSEDWTQHSIKTLALSFKGVSTNDAEQMYVKVGDGGTTVKVDYSGSPDDLRFNEWQEWNIPLSSFAGVDKNSVTYLCVGFGTGSSSAEGTVEIDDIRLYPSRCVADQSQPAGDLDDDCTVDNNDVDLLTGEWLIDDANIATSSPSATGQVAYYDFEGDFQDSWANAIHGTAIGDAALFNDTGGRGNVLKLDGTGDYVDCTNNANFDITGSMTVAAWIKVTFFDKSYQAFVTKGNDAWRILRLNAPDSANFGHEGLSSAATGGYSNINDGQWHHVAGVYDSSAQETYMYIDGLAETTQTSVTGTIDTTAFKVLIGADDSEPEQPGREFDGLIDEVRIYSRALSQAEIAYLAADGAANLYIAPRSIANIHVEGCCDDAVNFRDLAKMLQATWATEQTWP